MVGALVTNTHTEDLSPHWLNRLGFAPADVWFLRWERLFTSALVTIGGWVFWQAVGMVALAVRGLVNFFGFGLDYLSAAPRRAEWCSKTLRRSGPFDSLPAGLVVKHW